MRPSSSGHGTRGGGLLRALPTRRLLPGRRGGECRRGEQFNIIHPGSGLKIDVFPANDEVARSQIERGRRLPALPGFTAVFSAAEELIIKKLEYYRLGGSDRHLRDVRAMLDISGEEIDLRRVQEWIERLELADIWALVSDPSE